MSLKNFEKLNLINFVTKFSHGLGMIILFLKLHNGYNDKKKKAHDAARISKISFSHLTQV